MQGMNKLDLSISIQGIGDRPNSARPSESPRKNWNEPPMWVQQVESPSNTAHNGQPGSGRRLSARRRSSDTSTLHRPQSANKKMNHASGGKNETAQRKRKRPFIQIPESQVLADQSPDSGIRQIFRSSSPSLMMELSRLIGDGDDVYRTEDVTPHSPKSLQSSKSPTSQNSPQSPNTVRSFGSIQPYNVPFSARSSGPSSSRPTSSRPSTATSSSYILNLNLQLSPKAQRHQLYQYSKDLPEPEEILSARTPRSSNSTNTTPSIQSARASMQNVKQSGRAVSPSQFINPEAILDREPIILQKRPKSTYLLDQLLREKNSQDHYRRSSESQIYSKSSSSTPSVLSTSSRRRSSNVTTGTTYFMESDRVDYSTIHSTMKIINDFSTPQIRRRSIRPPETMRDEAGVPIPRPKSSVISRKRNSGRSTSSVSSRRRGKSVPRGLNGEPKIYPGYFQSTSQRLPASQKEGVIPLSTRYLQTEQPRNQFSVRSGVVIASHSSANPGSNVAALGVESQETEQPKMVHYESRGAGFLSIRKSSRPRWESYQKAKEIRLRLPSSQKEAPRPSKRDPTMKNLLHIQSIQISRTKQESTHQQL